MLTLGLVTYVLSSLLITRVVEKWKLKLMKLVYDVRRVLTDADVSRELGMEVQDVVEECMVEGNRQQMVRVAFSWNLKTN
jgi:hypothetical protein